MKLIFSGCAPPVGAYNPKDLKKVNGIYIEKSDRFKHPKGNLRKYYICNLIYFLTLVVFMLFFLINLIKIVVVDNDIFQDAGEM